MQKSMNNTCDPALRSWVFSANDASTEFPIQNLPFGVFRDREGEGICIWMSMGLRMRDCSRGCLRKH
jgi:fumarylacetoacetase